MADGTLQVPARDGFEDYLAEKLWASFPSIHRHEDGIAPTPGVLRGLVEVLAGQAAIVRRSNNRVWEDQYIEWCDDWAVPYIGDLVGTRMIAALNRRGARVDVAKTIHYRRRKGTLTVLEELTRDITGWEGTAVETFRRLIRTHHGLDARPARRAGRHSGTPAGGWADLRRPAACHLVGGPFDEFHRTPDFRRRRGNAGRYGIPKLALHLYRLRANAVTGVRPRTRTGGGFTFDPAGRDVPLFMLPAAGADPARRQAREWELPYAMPCRVLGDAEFMITEEIVQQVPNLGAAAAAGLRRLRGWRIPDEATLDELVAAVAQPPPLSAAALATLQSEVRSRALLDDCGKDGLLAGAPLPASLRVLQAGVAVGPALMGAADLAGPAVPAAPGKRVLVDPERGRLAFLGAAPAAPVTADLVYGAAADIGAGTYDRHDAVRATANTTLSNGGAIASADVLNAGVTQVNDSATYQVNVTKQAVTDATFQAADQRRPYLELTADLQLGTAAAANARLVLEGLWLGGTGRLVLRGDFAEVTIRHCTLDPGGVDSDGKAIPPVRLTVNATVDRLVIESSIVAPIDTAPLGSGPAGAIERLEARDSVIDARGPANLALATGQGWTVLERVTVFGDLDVHRLSASEALVTGGVDVTDTQAGCWRFSAAPAGARVPRPYESVVLGDTGHLFTSRRFGHPGYAQLSQAAPSDVAQGGESGSEIGAHSSLLDPVKLAGLAAKVDEYLPFGLVPMFIEEN